MPPSAAVAAPGLSEMAPVNEPFIWPKTSDSSRSCGMAPQFSAMNGPAARFELSCTASAQSSLPVPLSPVMNTVAIDRATERILAWMRTIASEDPMKAPLTFGRVGAASFGTRAMGDLRAARSPAAFSTAPRKRCSSKGFTRNSCAPARIASTALLMDPLAVITMTAVSGCKANMSCITSSPSRSGKTRSSKTTSGTVSTNCAMPSAALLATRTPWPADIRTDL